MYPHYKVDNFLLDPTVFMVEKASNIPVSAIARYGTFTIANMDGAVPNRLGMSTGKVLLSIVVSQSSALDLLTTVNELSALFISASTVSKQDSYQSSWKTVPVVELDSFAVEQINPTAARVNAVFTVQPFWRESGDPVVTATRLSTGVVTLGEFNRCTGKLIDAVIRFKGPFTSARVEGFNNTGITVSGSFSASDYVFVDLANMRAWKSTSHDSWTGKGAPVDWDYPAGGMLTLEPDFETGRRRYALKLTVSGTTTQSAFSVRSSKWHL